VKYNAVDPLQLIARLWPNITLYDKQAEVLYSLVDNDETLAPAGNQLGKDFVSALGVLYFFLSRPVARVVTTSVDEGQLKNVLWGEIRNFVTTAAEPLPLLMSHLEIKKLLNDRIVEKAYVIGRVAKVSEGLLGHHLARGPNYSPTTLMVYDEGSGIPHEFKEKTDTWAHRTLIIGNPFPCENFFKQGAKEGSVKSRNGDRYYRKVIHIRAEDSPNVRYGLAEKAKGLEPSNKTLIPGVLGYEDYDKRRTTWDKIRQCISLDAEFYEGSEVLLYPPLWLSRAASIGRDRPIPKVAKAIGVDPAEGGDNTTMVAVDEYGMLDLQFKKTPDTNTIVGDIIAFARYWGVKPENVMLDRGGGGKQHADRLRAAGFPVRTVAFGEPVSPEPKRGLTTIGSRKLQLEERYTYVNRRAEMYGTLRELLDPANDEGYALPPHLLDLKRPDGGASLREQLAKIPLVYTSEGRMKLPSKRKTSAASKEPSLTEIIGCSPDEADALVLALYAMKKSGHAVVVG
jgi:hypothetical protein